MGSKERQRSGKTVKGKTSDAGEWRLSWRREPAEELQGKVVLELKQSLICLGFWLSYPDPCLLCFWVCSVSGIWGVFVGFSWFVWFWTDFTIWVFLGGGVCEAVCFQHLFWDSQGVFRDFLVFLFAFS